MHTSLIDQKAKQLSDVDLVLFREPVSWHQILVSCPHRREGWWRSAIIEADEDGRGLIAWNKHTKCWLLSERGRVRLGNSKHVRSI